MSWQLAAAAHRAIRNYESSTIGRLQARNAELEARVAELEQQLSTKPTEIIRTVEIPVFRKPALEGPLATEPGLNVRTIKQAVAAYYDIDVMFLESRRRDWQVARPRQVAMFLACHHTAYTLPQIGRMFGKRDHTTVLHAREAVTERMKTDDKIAADVAAIRAVLGVPVKDAAQQ